MKPMGQNLIFEIGPTTRDFKAERCYLKAALVGFNDLLLNV